jgi:hypothetical protein
LPGACPAGCTLPYGFFPIPLFETGGWAVPLRSSGKGSLATLRRQISLATALAARWPPT